MLAASLPHPPGINRTYRSTRGGRWYKVDAAMTWEQSAMIHLRLAGFRSQPAGAYSLALGLTLYTIRHDVDAPVKIAVDLIARALAIDDRWLGALLVLKVPVRRREEQRLEVTAELRRLSHASEFESIARAYVSR